MQRYICSIVCSLAIAASSTKAMAQEPESREAPERRIFGDMLQQQERIWTSPAHLKRRHLKWLLPLAGISTALILTDHRASTRLSYPPNQLSSSRAFSNAGVVGMDAAAGAFYLFGHLEHNRSAVETGLRGAEALADSEIVVTLLKTATSRRRPDKFGSDGGFWTGGDSFPSGHTIDAWSVAAVFASRYPGNRWLKFGSYSVAAAVGVARFTGERHYPSDVVVGAVLGYLIGHYVAHQQRRETP